VTTTAIDPSAVSFASQLAASATRARSSALASTPRTMRYPQPRVMSAPQAPSGSRVGHAGMASSASRSSAEVTISRRGASLSADATARGRSLATMCSASAARRISSAGGWLTAWIPAAS
jgi:hypothetical protein